MDLATSFAASSFRKVLKGFEIGGLPYTDVQFHLRRLLAAGTPPDELQEVLRRCELITPLPDYAHAEVLQIIEEAKERAAAQALEHEIDFAPDESESSVEAGAESHMMREALEAEQTKARDLGRALAERIASEQAARARGEEARRGSEQVQAELRSARHSISDRDAVIAQMRVSLDESNTRLAEAQRERAETRAYLESGTKSGTQTLADLVAARAEAEKLRRESQQRLAEMAALRESLLAGEGTTAELRRALADSNVQLVSLRQQLDRVTTAHNAQVAALQKAHADFDIARSRAAALEAGLAAARAETEKMQRDSQQSLKPLELELHSARKRIDALEREVSASRNAAAPLRTERDALRAQLMAVQSKLRDTESLAATLQQSVRSDARRMAELQAAAVPRAASSAAVSPAPAAASPAAAASASPPAEALQIFPGKRAPQWKPNTRARVAGSAAAIVVLAVMVWAYSRRGSEPVLAPAAPAVGTPKPGTVMRDCPDCPALTVLPAGRFEQGSASSAAGTGSFEKPLHAVAIAYPVAMSTNAVTVDQFRDFVTATGRSMQGCDIYDGDWRHRPDNGWDNPGFAQSGSHPVTCASWNDAKAYAGWLSAKTGHHYRLPSASEWEYAARAGGAAVQPWPDSSTACAGANVADQSAVRRYPGWAVFACDDGYVFTAPVGTFKPNTFGLNDMLGNVFQWTEDCWNPDYAGAPADGSARADGDCSERELRGGSWFSNPAYVRANYRNHFGADYRTSTVGIRLVRDMDS
jgi:formylglycine-generating enzyme required for sulfatase activity